MTTLSEYWDALDRFDWFYEYSDDGSVWRRGNARLGELQRIARESPEHQALYDGHRNHRFTGPNWVGANYALEAPPKPERPPGVDQSNAQS